MAIAGLSLTLTFQLDPIAASEVRLYKIEQWQTGGSEGLRNREQARKTDSVTGPRSELLRIAGSELFG
jgi:hypothetical protein